MSTNYNFFCRKFYAIQFLSWLVRVALNSCIYMSKLSDFQFNFSQTHEWDLKQEQSDFRSDMLIYSVAKGGSFLIFLRAESQEPNKSRYMDLLSHLLFESQLFLTFILLSKNIYSCKTHSGHQNLYQEEIQKPRTSIYRVVQTKNCPSLILQKPIQKLQHIKPQCKFDSFKKMFELIFLK